MMANVLDNENRIFINKAALYELQEFLKNLKSKIPDEGED